MTQDHKSNRRSFLGTAAAVAAGAMFPPRGTATDESRVTDESGATGESESQPIIDCHLHINHFERTIEDTIRHLDATGTAKAFILPLETGEGNVLLRTETVLHAFHQHRDRIIPFCQTDIRQPDVLERIKAFHLLGCKGIGEQKEHVPLGDPRVEQVIALCDELNWPITIHFQDGPNGYNQGIADHLETYLKRYRRVRIIGHAQSWWAHISADVPPPEKSLYPKGRVQPGGLIDRLMSEYPNLYGDMSAGSGFGALSRDEDFTGGFLERHRRQLLFGSDCPCFDGRGKAFKGMCYSTRLQEFLERMVSDRTILKDLYHDNAMRALTGTSA